MAGDFLSQIQDGVEIASLTDPETVDKARGIVANMIGLTLRGAADAIVADIDMLIVAQKWEGVDGYVLALSRIVSHERANEMVTKAFTRRGHKVPAKYSSLLGATRSAIGELDRLIGQ